MSCQDSTDNHNSTEPIYKNNIFVQTKVYRIKPVFIHKLYDMLEDPRFSVLLWWVPEGDAFFLEHSNALSNKLPLYFKHTNINSFIRLLNMYGFYKVSSSGYSTRVWKYKHIFNQFRRGCREDLKLIKRNFHKEANSQDINCNVNLNGGKQMNEEVHPLSQEQLASLPINLENSPYLIRSSTMSGTKEVVAGYEKKFNSLKEDYNYMSTQFDIFFMELLNYQKGITKLIDTIIEERANIVMDPMFETKNSNIQSMDLIEDLRTVTAKLSEAMNNILLIQMNRFQSKDAEHSTNIVPGYKTLVSQLSAEFKPK